MLLCPRQPPFAMQRRPRTLRLTVMLVKHRQCKALSVSKEFYAKAAEATAFVQQPETLTYKGTGSESGGVAGMPRGGSDWLHQLHRQQCHSSWCIMYDRLAKTSRRFEHPSTHAENRTFHVHESVNAGIPTDGIALTLDRSRVFYCALSGVGLYSFSTELFRDFAKDVQMSLMTQGEKPDISEGMAFGSDGSLFFGGLKTVALYR